MEKQFNISLQNRKILRSVLRKVPVEMLEKIPEGYRNNLFWNIAHIPATQQILLYRLSGLPTRLEEDWVDMYKKGTSPETKSQYHDDDIEHLCEVLMDTAQWAEEDYKKGIFREYQEYTTSTNVTLSSVEDAICFNNYHEGIHLGVVLSQLKSLGIRLD